MKRGEKQAHTHGVYLAKIFTRSKMVVGAHGFPCLYDFTLKIKWFFMFIAQILLLLFPLVVIAVFLLVFFVYQ